MRDLWTTDSGQDLIEYTLLMALTLIAACLVLVFFVPSILVKKAEKQVAATPTFTQQAKAAPQNAAQAMTPEPTHLTDATSPLVIALFASLLASVAWNAKQMVSSLTNVTQLTVLEILSSAAEGMTRQELMNAAQGGKRLRFLLPTSDALAQLVANGRVTIKNGNYRMSDDANGSDSNKATPSPDTTRRRSKR